MKRILILGMVVVVAAAMVLPATQPVQATGNGAPSGAHFNLNIIGVPHGKTAVMTSGNRIFVMLGSKDQVATTKINLSMGPYAVLDGNGTDGTAAFRLPNPDPDGDGVTLYSVWARALGKPGGSSSTTTCFTDTTGTYCSDISMPLVRVSGKSKFTDVSKYLLYVYADIDADLTTERVSLFSDPLAAYYWEYDNSGLKLAQLRFYEVPSTVPAP